MSNPKDTRLIIGRRIGGDEEDIYQDFWIGIWTLPNTFKIVDFHPTSSGPLLSNKGYVNETIAWT